MDTTTNTVLILGARGRFGLSTARAFAQAGWRVLGQARPTDAVPGVPAVQWLGIDLQDTQALAQAAQGATVVVHALNPAYTNKAWKTQVLPMTDAAIGIARALGATLMVPGNVYNYGADMPAVLREETPQRARTVKGQVRMEMEERLRRSGVRSIVIRAGDFFGGGTGTFFDSAMVKNIRSGQFTYPGAADVSTAWAYLPDLARTFVAVAQSRAKLPPFEVLHFGGHRMTGQRWMEVLTPIARAQGWIPAQGQIKLGRLPWGVIRIGAWFMPTWAALMEMQYLWFRPYALANEKLTALIGAEPHTPLAQAVQAALVDLGMVSTPSPVATQGGQAHPAAAQ